MPELTWKVTEKSSGHVAIDILLMVRRPTTNYVLQKGAKDTPFTKAIKNLPLKGHHHHERSSDGYLLQGSAGGRKESQC